MSNRKALLLIGGLILLILFSAYFGSNRREFSAVCSSHSPFPRGLKALYLFLAESKIPVDRLDRNLEELSGKGRGLIVIAEPSRAPVTRNEARALLTWVKQGNIALIASRCGEGAPRAGLDEYLLQTLQINCKATQVWQDPLERAMLSTADSISVNRGIRSVSSRRMSDPNIAVDHAVVLLQQQSRPVAFLWRSGNGMILFLATTSVLENSEMNHEQNLQFIWNFIQMASPRTVLFDEYHHGYQQLFSAISARRLRVLSWTALQLFLLLVIYLLLRRSRLGPARKTPSLKGRSALETIQSLAFLFLKARKFFYLGRSLQENLRNGLQKKYHVPKTSTDLEELIHSGLLTEQEGTDLKVLLEYSFSPRTSESQFVDFAAQIDHWRARLRL